MLNKQMKTKYGEQKTLIINGGIYMKVKLLMILLLVFFSTWSCLASGESELRKILPQYIVSAKVIAVENYDRNNNYVLANLEVTHVYRGPEDLVLKKFQVLSEKRNLPPWNDTTERFKIYPTLKKGEIGIWPLRLQDEDNPKQPKLVFNPLDKFINSAYRKGISKDYVLIKELAEIIEKLEQKQDKEDRMSILKKNLAGTNPKIVIFAIDVLPVIDEEEGLKVVKDKILHGEKVSFEYRIVADRVVSAHDKTWASSEKRVEMFRKWVAADYNNKDKQDIDSALLDIRHAFRDKHIERSVLLELLRKAIGNKTIPISIRSSYISMLPGFIKEKDHDEYFDYLLQIIHDSGIEKIQCSAAAGIKNHIPLTEERIIIIKKIIEKIKNKDLKKTLYNIFGFKSQKLNNDEFL